MSLMALVVTTGGMAMMHMPMGRVLIIAGHECYLVS